MGGPCKILKPVPEEKRIGQFMGPPCTDNFQIIDFPYEQETYHSVEQAYQALKFQKGSMANTNLRGCCPKNGETSGEFGMRVWKLGQDRGSPLIADFEKEKVKLMYLLNVAKYAAHSKLQRELIEQTTDPTSGEVYELKGPASTWEWQKWNGLINTLIRKKVMERQNLNELLVNCKGTKAEVIEKELESVMIKHESDSD